MGHRLMNMNPLSNKMNHAVRWELKKEINLSFVVALLAQVAVAIWWVSDFNAWRRQADERIQSLGKSVETTIQRADAIDREVTDRLGRIETMLANIEKRLDQRGAK